MRLSMKTRVVLNVVLVLAVSMGALVAVISQRSTAMARSAAVDHIEQRGAADAAHLEQGLQRALDVTDTLADTLRALSGAGGTREQADAVLRTVLGDDENLLGTWTAWEPDAFDGQDARYVGAPGHDATGRYIPYWHREGEDIALEPLLDYLEPGAGDYYLLARDSGRTKVLEPYVYAVGGADVTMTSVVTPIAVDGRVVGVAGVDIPVDEIQGAVAGIRALGTGHATLVSTGGAVVGSNRDLEVGTVLDGAAGALAARAVREGTTVSDAGVEDGVEVLRVATPMPLGESDTWALVVDVPTSTALAASTSLNRLSLVLALVALLVAAVAAYLVARSVARPVEVLRDRMAEIADGDGDLTQRVDASRRDEAGELGAAFNRFVETVADTIRAIAGSAGSLGGAAAQLTAVAGSLGTGAAQTLERAQGATAAAAQIDSGMQSLATGAEQMSASIQEIAGNAARAASVANEAVAVAGGAQEQIGELGTVSAEIGGVVQLITSIAEQTNLLALNATIEAARAGESGKGFAVVAGEVKELAQQTARATEDITRRIGAIQTSSAGAVAAMGRIREVVGQIDDVSASIAGAVEEQSATAAEMRRTSTDAADGSGQVVRAASAVAEVAGATADDAGATQRAAADLTELAAQMRGLVERFRV